MIDYDESMGIDVSMYVYVYIYFLYMYACVGMNICMRVCFWILGLKYVWKRPVYLYVLLFVLAWTLTLYSCN